MIDLHCHILPGIDDGPATIEESVALARAAALVGTRTIVATPHVSRSYRNDPQTIRDLVGVLVARLRDEQIALEILPGAEVAMSWVNQLDSETLQQLTLGETSCLLIEPPFSTIVTGFDTVVLELMRSGHRVLIAHPERCPAFHRDSSPLATLIEAGALASLTAGSLRGRFGGQVRRSALRLLDDGLIHNVASDAHDEKLRPPGMAAEVRQAGLEDLSMWLTQSVPAAILSEGPIPPRPTIRAAGTRNLGGLLRRVRGR